MLSSQLFEETIGPGARVETVRLKPKRRVKLYASGWIWKFQPTTRLPHDSMQVYRACFAVCQIRGHQTRNCQGCACAAAIRGPLSAVGPVFVGCPCRDDLLGTSTQVEGYALCRARHAYTQDLGSRPCAGRATVLCHMPHRIDRLVHGAPGGAP